MNMDYALMSTEMVLLLLVVWLVSGYRSPIYNRKKRDFKC